MKLVQVVLGKYVFTLVMASMRRGHKILFPATLQGQSFEQWLRADKTDA